MFVSTKISFECFGCRHKWVSHQYSWWNNVHFVEWFVIFSDHSNVHRRNSNCHAALVYPNWFVHYIYYNWLSGLSPVHTCKFSVTSFCFRGWRRDSPVCMYTTFSVVRLKTLARQLHAKRSKTFSLTRKTCERKLAHVHGASKFSFLMQVPFDTAMGALLSCKWVVKITYIWWRKCSVVFV